MRARCGGNRHPLTRLGIVTTANDHLHYYIKKQFPRLPSIFDFYLGYDNAAFGILRKQTKGRAGK